ncbi:TIR domain-containing protein [Brunnivagina elsteri]|uniref:TIR-like domain-containing protein n=1 Tax=Brunnivagina elsteri CCALA 953 TaxID=987040 RepID=A0A2A2TN77_9CYAN|nr:TIR domain-containing protein [Calothrix elsteri]PAX59804.1 TIR-like domain-containing protein [Calothrix elsteri CCALA 953]
MARRAFFSFHYQRDIWRVNQVRNSWVIQPGKQEAVWYDASLWEEARTKGETALKNLINDGLTNTSVTVVLIGAETSTRKWVDYEIKESYARGKGLLGIYIHGLKDKLGKTDIQGKNPFNNIYVETSNQKTYFSDLYPTYDWVLNEGYKNIGLWIEKAASAVGR